MLTYYSREGFDVQEDIKTYIESKKFNVKNTVRDTNIILKIMHERHKLYIQLSSQFNFNFNLLMKFNFKLKFL